MPQAIKVFTPIKRVPTMIGKAQNGQKLPFGPYTLPQVVAAIVLIMITSVLAMSLPVNPAVTFIGGLVLTIAVVFAVGLVPYTGVRMTSRILWIARLIVIRKPTSASGMPITSASERDAVFVDESIVVIFPNAEPAQRITRNTPLIAMPETWIDTALGSRRAALSGGNN